MEVQRDAVEGRLDRVGRLEHDRFRGGAEGPFLHRTQRYPRADMIELVGHDVEVPCADGSHRRYRSFDTAASTSALPAVAEAVTDFLPWYSSVHRGAGFKSQRATQAYELARRAALRFAGRDEDGEDVAVLCRNTPEAINHIS
jgi:selenocysteine lyase/cysteine desulfurase